MIESLEPRILLSASLDWVAALQQGGNVASPQVLITDLEAGPGNQLAAAGQFRGTTNFNPAGDSAMLTSGPGVDGFVARYSKADGSLQWVRLFQTLSSGSSVRIAGVEVDQAGNVYFAGTFDGSVDFDPGDAIAARTASQSDLFLGQFDADGQLQWLQVVGGAGDESISDVHLTRDSQLLVSGDFNRLINFDPDGAATASVRGGGTDGFIAAYDADDGSFIDLVTLQNQSALFTSVNNLHEASNGDLLFTATAANNGASVINLELTSADAGVLSNLLVLPRTSTNVVGRLSSSLDQLVWLNQFNSALGDFSRFDSIAENARGDLFLVGQLDGALDLDPGPEVSRFTPAGSSAPLVLSLAPDGQFRWGTILDAAQGQATDVVINAAGDIIVGGNFATRSTTDPRLSAIRQVDFDPGEGVATGSSRSTGSEPSDVFLWTLDEEGNFIEALILGNTDRDTITAMAFDPTSGNGRLLVAGQYNATRFGQPAGAVDFDFADGAESRTGEGAFIARYQDISSGGVVGSDASAPPISLPRNLAGQFDLLPAVTIPLGTSTQLAMTFTNTGSVTTPGTLVDLFASRNGTLDGGDVRVGRFSVPAIAAGSSRQIVVNTIIPTSQAAGNFRLVGIVDPANAILETQEDDNVFVSDNRIAITQPDFNLTAGVGSIIDLPTTLAETQTSAGLLQGTLTNTGSAVIPRGTLVNVDVVARPIAGGDDVVLNARPVLVNVGGLAGGATRLVNVPIAVPRFIRVGDFDFVFRLDTNGVLTETDESVLNNSFLVPDARLTVTPTDIDVVPTSLQLTGLPANVLEGASLRSLFQMTLQNLSDVTLPAGTLARVEIVAVGQNSQAVLGTVDNVNLAGLRSNQSRLVSGVVNIPPTLENGSYEVVGRVALSNLFEDVTSNNQVSSGRVISVAPAFVDVTAGPVTTFGLAPAIVQGQSPRVTLRTSVLNGSNIAMPLGSLANVDFVLRPVGAQDSNSDVLLTTVNNVPLSGLGAGLSRPVAASVLLPGNLDLNQFQVVARVDSSNLIAERDEFNNETASLNSVNVALPFVDLAAGVDGSRLPAATVSGNGQLLILPVTITNVGNVSLSPGQAVAVQVFARPVDGGDDVLVDTFESQIVGSLLSGQTRTLILRPTLPAGLASGNYQMVAVVDPVSLLAPFGSVDESDDLVNNAAATTQTIAIERGFVDLVASLGVTRLPVSVISGDTTTPISLPVLVTNTGNVATAPDAAVSVSIFAEAQGQTPVLVHTRNNLSLRNLLPGTTRSLPVNFTLPVGLASGIYRLITVVDSGNAVVEELENNNTVVTEQTVSVIEGTNDLDIVFAEHGFTATVETGNTSVATIALQNLGNVEATGDIDVEVFATQAGVIDTSSVLVGRRLNVPLRLTPGVISTAISTPMTIPLGLNGLFTLVARVTPSLGSTIGDAVAANNVQALNSTIRVLERPTPEIFGDVTFTELAFEDQTSLVPSVGRVGQVISTGTIVNTNGQSGTYTYTAVVGEQFDNNRRATLTLQFAGTPQLVAQDMALLFNQPNTRPESLAGRTLQFRSTPLGSLATFDGGNNVLFRGEFVDVDGFVRVV